MLRHPAVGQCTLVLTSAGAHSLTASYIGDANVTGSTSAAAPHTVTPGTATSLQVTGLPSTATAGQFLSFTVNARDAYGNLATGYGGTVHLTSSDPSLSAGYSPDAALVGGTGSFSAFLVTAGSRTITATDTVVGSINGTSSAITITAAAAVGSIAISPTSSSIASGASQAYTVTAFDQYGNSKGTVSAALGIINDGSCGASSCTATTAGLHVVTATYSGKTATSNLTVTAGALDHLVLSPASSSITSGGSQAYTAVGYDVNNNSLGDVTSTTTFSITPNGSCTGASCTATVAGPHTVTGTKSTKTGTASLAVSAGGGGGSTATKLAFGQQPTSRTAGSVFIPQITVRILDASNALVATDNTTQVTLSIGTNPGGGTLAGTVTRTAVNGVASFPGLSINKSANGYRLTATSTPVLTSVNSNLFNITPGTATTLVVSGYANPTVAGANHTFTVTAKDAFGNTATGYRGRVRFTSNDSQASLPGNYTFTNGDNGVETFSARLRTAGTRSITVTDRDNGSINGTQSGIVVQPAALDDIELSPSMYNITAGQSRAYTVTAYDQYGNSRGTVSAALSISPNGSCGASSCTATVAGAHVVTASYLGQFDTAFLYVNPSAAHHLQFTQQPTRTNRFAPIAPSVRVGVYDQYNNLVDTDSAVVTIAIGNNPGGATLSGTKVRTTSDGIATFNNLSMNVRANGYTLVVSSPGLNGATSSSFRID